MRSCVAARTMLIVCVPFVLTACASTTPSARVQNKVHLPTPESAATEEALAPPVDGADDGELRLTARSVIGLAFNRQPDITSSFQAFKAEEARYDFFYASNDALTPRFQTSNTLEQARFPDSDIGHRIGERGREHTVEVGVDKQFFDTTTMSIATGLDSRVEDEETTNQPFLSASVRYPLWGSREKLARTSDDIFRQNELNDAQLNYIEQVRQRLERALESFYEVLGLRAQVAAAERWQRGLQALAARLESIEGRDLSADRRRVEAELASVNTEVRNLEGRYRVELARLKFACGIPYETEIEFDEEPFNPFEGETHEELLRTSIETDPEIATLRNAMQNSEVQLNLARRGKWDVALLLAGKSQFRSHDAVKGSTDWSVSAGLEVSAVDPRVTSSLLRQARASIARFRQAIVARESLIYADTLEPLIRIETLGASREELIGNLGRYQEDYEVGVSEYVAGRLNIDDLLTRRETIFEQEEEIAQLAHLVGANVAELCSATGKFFELLNNSTN